MCAMSKYQNAYRSYTLPNGKTIKLLPNQQVFKVTKDNYRDNNSTFVQIGEEELMNAIQSLSVNGLKLYLYFCCNMNGYIDALWSIDICNTIGISQRSYYTAKKQLEDEGYIHVCRADSKTQFYDVIEFYSNPSLNPHNNTIQSADDN